MTLILVSHVALAIIMFFCINFLGQHTPSDLGYYQLTTFSTNEEAPAFNFLIRVLTPSVFLILVSAILYAIRLDRLITKIYMVSVYYVLFRMFFNIAMGRALLINWTKSLTYSISIVVLSYFIYIKLIVVKSNLLPDFENMANELWVIMIVFIYSVLNQIKISDSNTLKRKERYVATQFASINKRYSPIIIKQTNNLRLRQIALAIIIYENFNRPKLFRLVEYFKLFMTKKPHTVGIMQVLSNRYIGDKESVRLGISKLIKDFDDLSTEFKTDNKYGDLPKYKEEIYQRKLIEKFNPELIYSYEVIELANEINQKYFSDAPTELFSATETSNVQKSS